MERPSLPARRLITGAGPGRCAMLGGGHAPAALILCLEKVLRLYFAFLSHRVASQTLISPWPAWPLAEARRRPSGLNARLRIKPAWPRRVTGSADSGAARSQTFTVESQLPEAR